MRENFKVRETKYKFSDKRVDKTDKIMNAIDVKYTFTEAELEKLGVDLAVVRSAKLMLSRTLIMETSLIRKSRATVDDEFKLTLYVRPRDKSGLSQSGDISRAVAVDSRSFDKAIRQITVINTRTNPVIAAVVNIFAHTPEFTSIAYKLRDAILDEASQLNQQLTLIAETMRFVNESVDNGK